MYRRAAEEGLSIVTWSTNESCVIAAKGAYRARKESEEPKVSQARHTQGRTRPKEL